MKEQEKHFRDSFLVYMNKLTRASLLLFVILVVKDSNKPERPKNITLASETREMNDVGSRCA